MSEGPVYNFRFEGSNSSANGVLYSSEKNISTPEEGIPAKTEPMVSGSKKQSKKELREELGEKISEVFEERGEFFETFAEKINDLFKKSKSYGENGVAARLSKDTNDILLKWNSYIVKFDDKNIRTQKLLTDIENTIKKADDLMAEVSSWVNPVNETDKNGLDKKKIEGKIYLAENILAKQKKAIGDIKATKESKLKPEQAYLKELDDVVGMQGDLSDDDYEKLKVKIEELKKTLSEIWSVKDGEIKEEKYKYSRAGAEITLSRIKEFKELDAEKAEDRDRLFLEKTRELWKEFAVHGFLELDEDGKTKLDDKGEPIIKEETDLDGRCCLQLLKLAGLNINDLKYTAPGKMEEGRINVDTGSMEGVGVVSSENPDTKLRQWSKTAYADHHGKDSKHGTSASQYVYKMLVDSGLLKRNIKLDRMINFVTNVDNAQYPGRNKYFENASRTVSGLERYMSGENLVKFFTEDKTPNPARVLTADELRKYGFLTEDKDGKTPSERQLGRIKLSLDRLKWMQENGLIIDSDKYGKIAIGGITSDDKKIIPNEYAAVRAFGCDTYIYWDPNHSKFRISSNRKIEEDYGSEGLLVREKMWVKNDGKDEPLKITLEEILERMTDDKFKIPTDGKLKELIENGFVEIHGNGKENGKGGEERKSKDSEKSKEKSPKEFFNEVNKKAFGVLSIAEFQSQYDVYKKIVADNGAEEKLSRDQIEIDARRLCGLCGRLRGEELEKMVKYILEQLK